MLNQELLQVSNSFSLPEFWRNQIGLLILGWPTLSLSQGQVDRFLISLVSPAAINNGTDMHCWTLFFGLNK